MQIFPKLDALLHDDLLFVIPTGHIITKAMDISNLESGNLVISEIQSEQQSIQMFETTAIVTTLVYLKASYLEHPIDGQFQYIRTWQRFGDAWKVIGGAGVAL